MADGLPPTPPPHDGPADPPQGGGQPPPPLSAIRVKGPGAKGLNKPAILVAGGGGLALVLVLASGGFTNDGSKKPAEARPMMSDPARPEMAKSAIRNLPATYEEAAIAQAATQPASPPLLGPPMAGDIAAFAPEQAQYNQPEASWSGSPSGYADAPGQPDPAEQEAQLADRSSVFFELRQAQAATPTAGAATPVPQSPLTALRAPQDDPQTATRSTATKNTLHPGAVIPASLITAINSEAPGPVIAQVTQAIYDSATGRTLLIPQGAKLIGDYKSSAKYGQSRVAIVWSRLIMPNGDEIPLDEAAVDPSGAAGVKGDVDNHWGEVFGAAALGTLINIGVAATEDQPGITFGGVGVASNYDPVQDALRDGVQRSAAVVTNRVVDRSLAIPPTIKVEAGTRISVIATRRMLF